MMLKGEWTKADAVMPQNMRNDPLSVFINTMNFWGLMATGWCAIARASWGYWIEDLEPMTKPLAIDLAKQAVEAVERCRAEGMAEQSAITRAAVKLAIHRNTLRSRLETARNLYGMTPIAPKIAAPKEQHRGKIAARSCPCKGRRAAR
jgi:hypothetical protein